jgi:sulfite exporter TauE/SafE
VRRLRRLLYAGVGGVITAVVGQLIEPLFNLDTYIFLILGAFLLAMGILIEQRREKVLQFAHELRLKLEDWE